MNKILFDANIQNLYSVDYEYLQDTFEEELQKLFRQIIQNPGIAAIIKGFDLAVSTVDNTKIMIYHDGGWGSLISSTGEIIETQDVLDEITPSDDIIGTENYVYVRIYKAQGTFNKSSETVELGVQSNIDLYDYSQTYDRNTDQWEIKVYTQAEVLSLSQAELDELICLGSFTANGSDPITSISTSGRVYIRTFIQEGSIQPGMISDGFLLPQINVDNSETIDDNFSGAPADIEDDLNKIRTIIREIKGTALYDEVISTSLLDADSSANKLHGNGVIRGEWDELEVFSSSTGLGVIVKSGKALVQGDVSHILPSETVELALASQTTYQVGDWDTRIAEEHSIGTPPTSFDLAHSNIGNLKITDKFNEPYPDGFDEDIDYIVNYVTGTITIPYGSRIANETVKCYYQWGYTRYDLVEFDEDSTAKIKTGIASETPALPTPTIRHMLLYQIKVDPFNQLVPIGNIIDSRSYAQNVRNLYELDCTDINYYGGTTNKITYFTSSGSVDLLDEQWVASIYRDRNVRITSTGGAYFEAGISCIDGDDLWLVIDRTPWENTIKVEWSSVAYSETLDQSVIHDISSKDRIEFYPIIITTSLTEGYHKVRVTVQDIRDYFVFYSLLIGKLDTYYAYDQLYGRPETEPYHISKLRGNFAPIYATSTDNRKGTLYLDTNKEVCTSSGWSLNYWDVEQQYPVSRVDQFETIGGGIPRTVTDLTDPIPENPATESIVFFTPSSTLIAAKQHQRVGFHIELKGTNWESIQVLIHDSNDDQIGTTTTLLFANIFAGWNYWEIDVDLTVGQTYHYHALVVNRIGTAPTLTTEVGTDEVNFVEMYKPYTGLFNDNDVVVILNKNDGTELVSIRGQWDDAPGDRYDQATLDVMGVDLSDDIVWDIWSYETYIGIDVATGRIKFPMGYDATDYTVEFNIKEVTPVVDAKSIMMHGETRSVEDQIWGMTHDALTLTVESDGLTSTGQIIWYDESTHTYREYTNDNQFYKVVGIQHSVPTVNKLGKTSPINICLRGLTYYPRGSWSEGDTLWLNKDGVNVVNQGGIDGASMDLYTKLGVIVAVDGTRATLLVC